MKKSTAACFALMVFALSPAYGEEAFDSKACHRKCTENLTPAEIKKSGYDAEAVDNDPTKTEAEKKKSHKKAIAGVCNTICRD